VERRLVASQHRWREQSKNLGRASQ